MNIFVRIQMMIFHIIGAKNDNSRKVELIKFYSEKSFRFNFRFYKMKIHFCDFLLYKLNIWVEARKCLNTRCSIHLYIGCITS